MPTKKEQAQIEEAAFKIKHLALTLNCFTDCYDDEKPKDAVDSANTISSFILQEADKIIATF